MLLNSRLASIALLGLLPAGHAAAQQTHIVQGADLQRAIHAAAPGDILLVSGAYSDASLSINKPLHIHGQPGASIHTFFLPTTIHSIPAGTSAVLQGFRFSGTGVQVNNNAGRVLLAGLSSAGAIAITDCVEVLIDECSFTRGTTVRASTVLIARSQCVGAAAFDRFGATPGLQLDQGRAIVVDSVVIGGDGGATAFHPPAAGIALIDADLRISGGGSRVAAGRGTATAVDAVSGTGRLAYDARTTFVPFGGGVGIDPRITGSLSRLPITLINRTALGAQATVEVVGQAGHVGLLLGASPATPLTIPGLEGELWTVPNALVVGALDGNGRLALTFTVPNLDVLRGALFRWQGVTFDGTVLRLAEPITESHF